MKTETYELTGEIADQATMDYFSARSRPPAARHDPMDRGLVANATHALSWLIGVPGVRLLITVENRWVTLAGQVDWDYQRCAAVRTIGQIRDVAGVSDLMTLKPRTTLRPLVQPTQTA